MTSNGKVIILKVVELIQIYNFCFDHFSIRHCLDNLKFEFQNMRTSNRILGY
jgi:hypothetical protein